MTTLLDGNVLIALAVYEHVDHDAAIAWLGCTDDLIATCPITQGAPIRMSRTSYPPGGAQPQQPPPQHPPAGAAEGLAWLETAPDSATVESSRTVSSCPDGHWAGSLDAVIGRLSSNVVEHSRQRNS